MRLVDSTGAPISVGGGTQYADGQAVATPTGNTVLWNDVGTERAASAAKPLPVNVISGGGLSVVDHASFTQSVSSFVPIGGVYNDGLNTMLSGEEGAARITHLRALHANPRTEGGVEIWPTPAALADTTANPTTTQAQTFGMLWNQTGSNWNRALGVTPFLAGLTPSTGATGLLAAASVIYNATGDTLAVQRSLNSLGDGATGGATAATGSLFFNGTNWDRGRTVIGAGGTTGAGLLGAGVLRLSVSHGSAPSTVTAGQYVPALSSRAGVAFVAPGHPNNITQTLNYSAAQTNTVLIANSAGTKIVVTSFMITASAANSVNVAAAIGLAQTVTPPSGTAGRLGAHSGIAPGSGFGRKCYQAGADGDQVLVTSTVATGGSIDCTIEYHTTPS